MNDKGRFIFDILVIILCLITITVIAFTPRAEQREVEKIFYILHTEAYQNMDGGYRIILDYSLNGETQPQGIFYTVEEQEAFIRHLDSIGAVKGYVK